jgi:hypothetical protein
MQRPAKEANHLRSMVLSQAATDSQILGLTDRMNKELGYYG